jgi:hypothetical protein
MTTRTDISQYLIHFTKGRDIEEAYKKLVSIINDNIIYGSNKLIKGGYKCVCFSETPIRYIPSGLTLNKHSAKYSTFGIMVDKDLLFKLGGRQVIYQSEEEYVLLSEEQRWRHVTYNPNRKPPIDFTWEREWRIRATELHINPTDFRIIMPNADWVERLFGEYEADQDWSIQQYKIILEDEIAEQYRVEFPYNIVTLERNDSF